MPHATPKNSTQNTPKIFCIKTPAPIPSKIATTIEMPSESPFAPFISGRSLGSFFSFVLSLVFLFLYSSLSMLEANSKIVDEFSGLGEANE